MHSSLLLRRSLSHSITTSALIAQLAARSASAAATISLTSSAARFTSSRSSSAYTSSSTKLSSFSSYPRFSSRHMSATTADSIALSSTPSASLDAPTPDNTFFFLCDIQETFRGKILNYEELIAASVFLCKAAGVLKIPIISTEQSPFKPTVHELSSLASTATSEKNAVFSKSLFSMLTPPVVQLLSQSSARRHIVLFGIEAHVCVLQTSLDLLRQGYQVHLVLDAVSSQTQVDRDTAIERLKLEGAKVAAPGSLVVTTAESVVYELVKDAQSPLFKPLVPAIKEYAAAKKAVKKEIPAASSGAAPSAKL